MSLTYAQLVTDLAMNLAVDPADTNYLTILPNCIDYAEQRIYREHDMLAANVRDASSSTVANDRNFTLPTTVGTFLIIDGINIITPASTAPDSGTRNPLIPVSRDFLDLAYASTSGATVPEYFAYLSQDTFSSPAQTQVIFGPWPDTTYRVEVIGKIQPTPLSASTTTNWISVNLPDLYLAACMVYMVGSYLKNFGSQSDDPKMGLSWESQYQLLSKSAQTYEARKRFSGASWTAKQVEPTAVPQRG